MPLFRPCSKATGAKPEPEGKESQAGPAVTVTARAGRGDFLPNADWEQISCSKFPAQGCEGGGISSKVMDVLMCNRPTTS